MLVSEGVDVGGLGYPILPLDYIFRNTWRRSAIAPLQTLQLDMSPMSIFTRVLLLTNTMPTSGLSHCLILRDVAPVAPIACISGARLYEDW